MVGEHSVLSYESHDHGATNNWRDLLMKTENIDTLRLELNKLIEDGASYDEIYKISTKLDEHIVDYYEKN